MRKTNREKGYYGSSLKYSGDKQRVLGYFPKWPIGCNKVVIELRVVQFLSEIRVVILNQTCAPRSFDFKIIQFNYHNKFQAKNRNRDECDIHTYMLY